MWRFAPVLLRTSSSLLLLACCTDETTTTVLSPSLPLLPPLRLLLQLLPHADNYDGLEKVGDEMAHVWDTAVTGNGQEMPDGGVMDEKYFESVATNTPIKKVVEQAGGATAVSTFTDFKVGPQDDWRFEIPADVECVVYEPPEMTPEQRAQYEAGTSRPCSSRERRCRVCSPLPPFSLSPCSDGAAEAGPVDGTAPCITNPPPRTAKTFRANFPPPTRFWRAFSRHFLSRQAMDKLAWIPGHLAGVSDLAYDAEGANLLTTGGNAEIAIRNLATREVSITELDAAPGTSYPPLLLLLLLFLHVFALTRYASPPPSRPRSARACRVADGDVRDGCAGEAGVDVHVPRRAV